MLLALDFFAKFLTPASLFYSLIRLVEGLIQKFCWTQNLRAIAKKKKKNKDILFPNKLDDLLNMEFLELENFQFININRLNQEKHLA